MLPGLIVVLVSELTDPETMSAALAAGGDGYLTKPFAASQCLATMKFSLRRCSSVSLEKAEVNSRWTNAADEYARFTDREHQVMSRLAKGLLYKEIADELRISYSTVHKHQQKIFVKLHVSNRTEAARKWYDLQHA